MTWYVRSVILAAIVCGLDGCKREQRVFDPGASRAQLANGVSVTEVHAGGTITAPSNSLYEQNAYAVAEGKRLYSAYNCVGCHQQGGGGIGPALMDSTWIYGSYPEQIYADIVEGRPNGMPSFAGRIPEYQVWELAAYVRSLSGQLPSDVAPSRGDVMPVAKAEQARTKEHPEDETVLPIQHAPGKGSK